VFTRLGFIDGESPAFELFAVEPLHGGCGRRTVGHLDKPKAFGAPGVPVGNHIDLVHHSIRLEELAEVMIRCTKRQVAYKNIHAKILYIVKNREPIARSSEQYAGVYNTRALCRRSGEEKPRGHTFSCVISSRMKISHIYNPKMYLWQGARRHFLRAVTGEEEI
jgi:hypothetical protein